LNLLLLELADLREAGMKAKTPSITMTEQLTKACEEHFLRLGCTTVREYHIEAIYRPKSESRTPFPRLGRIDLVVSSIDGYKLAIEIDRGNKKWSVEKLKRFQGNGPNRFGLWVRWGGRFKNVSVSEIILMDLTGQVEGIKWPDRVSVA
jgi:hypothetical protein